MPSYKPHGRTLANRNNDFLRLDPAVLAACPNISVDYAVMEKTTRAAVVVTHDLGWNDIGSWAALADLAEHDDAGNPLIGDVLTESVANSYVRADHRMVAAIGLDNVVIVETADAVLIAHLDHAQDGGLAKNTAQITTLFAWGNLWMVRKALRRS